MPRRKTPRSEEQTKKIIAALRERFFSEEAKATAARELEKVERRHAAEILSERAPPPPKPAPAIRETAADEVPFSDKERDQAWAILNLIKGMYGPESGTGEGDAPDPKKSG